MDENEAKNEKQMQVNENILSNLEIMKQVDENQLSNLEIISRTDENENLKNSDSSQKNERIMRHVIFPAMFCYLELMFHLFVFKNLDINIIYPLLFAIVAGCIVDFWTSCFSERINKWIAFITLSIACLAFVAQLVYNRIFKTFLSIYSIGENGADVMEFWKEAVRGIVAVFPGLCLLLAPIIFFVFVLKKGIRLERESMNGAFAPFLGAIAMHFLSLLFLVLQGTGAHTPYDLYHNNSLMDLSAQKLGLLTSIRGDIGHVIFGENLVLDEVTFVQMEAPDSGRTVIKPTDSPIVEEGNSDKQPLATSTPSPTPVDRSPNILEIDFEQLAVKEPNETIKTLHNYFSKVQPTNKNEYTGMFEGYNFIFLTAEGFSPWAVDQELTPTLYRLVNEGFVFNNFYTPIWYTSTSDGEYVACTGLLPTGTNSFSKSSGNAMPFCFGWQFKSLGYNTRAYHNHSYTYYNRNLTHPNMGYVYKGTNGGGLEVKPTWPESDLEMMELTIPEYINDKQFHTYYMTVSGHMYYTFDGNSMSAKNKDYVKNIPYSDSIKAYIASQKELDLALEYLIEQLKTAGVLENTVIALSADHYPYGLTNEEISEAAGHTIEENFELYKNNFILWSSSMEEPVIVDKYCSSLDIMPTLSNLFNIPYDSRLFMGQDILSDAEPLLIFGNQSFITDQVKYNSKTGEVVKLTDAELPDNYVKQYISIVRNKFNVSASILKNDYYSYLYDEYSELFPSLER